MNMHFSICSTVRIQLLAITPFLAWLAFISSASAYPVANSLPLDELVKEADFICKAEVVSTKPVEDASFEKVPAFQPYATELRLVSVFKGKTDKATIFFHHYGPHAEEAAFNFMPQYYKFEVGRTYIVFAKTTADKKVLRQLWQNHRSQEDQGVLLAAGNDMYDGRPIKQVFFKELTGLLKSGKQADVVYSLEHLDALSGGQYDKLKDLDRAAVLEAAKPLLSHADPVIAQQAIRLVGSSNPYFSHDFAAGWLATIGGGDIPGYSPWETGPNLGGKTHWKALAAVADSDAPAATRAMAIRALGRAEVPEVLPLVNRWATDREPAIRQAAAILLADFPGPESQEKLTTLAADPQVAVRIGAAQGIGFGQYKELIPLLGKLVDDPVSKVSATAALSLLSFSLKHNRAELTARVRHPQFRSLFVNALARETPEAYLSDLCEIIHKDLQPKDWWGGRIPWGVSWELLFRYAQEQTKEKPKRGDLDKVFEALESPASGKDGRSRYYSSSEPRDLYALYVQRGLADRAKKFRAACKKGLSYDIDYFFKMVDENPGQYERAR